MPLFRTPLTLFVFLLFLVLSTPDILAQSIRGRVLDAERKPVEYVNVELFHLPDSVFVASSLTDSAGKYRFNEIEVGTYYLIARHFNFESKYTTLTLGGEKAVFKEIVFTEKVSLISGGGITLKKEAVQQKNDTVEYNAGNYKVNQDATAENLVTKMPGITSENGTIKAHGEDVKKVTVDGQDFFGDDAAAALKNLPAEVIDKVQVFDRASDQSQFTGVDDGNSQKTLNIVTKTGKNNGQFGKVYGGYGTDDRWASGANVNIFKGTQRLSLIGMSNNINQQNFSSQDIIGLTGSSGSRYGGGHGSYRRGGSDGNFTVGQQGGINTTHAFGLNYSMFGGKKLKLTTSYFLNYGSNQTASFLNRNYFLNAGSNQNYQQGDTGKSKSFNHNLNLRLEYMFDSSNSLIFTPQLKVQGNDASSLFLGITKVDELSNLNKTFSRFDDQSQGYNFSQSLLLRHKFKKPGQTLSLNLATTHSKNEGESLLNSGNTYYLPVFEEIDFKQKTENNMRSFVFSPNLSYTQSLSKKAMIEMNYNPSFTNNNSYKYTGRFDTLNEQYTLTDSLLSNTFDNRSTTQKAGVTYRWNGSKWQFNLGSQVQSVNLLSDQTFPDVQKVDLTFTNVLPNASITYSPSKQSNLRISYRTHTDLPSISQLQNVVNNTNPLILSAGNDSLTQEYKQNLFIRFKTSNGKKGKTFFAFTHLSSTSNYIGNRTIIATRDTLINNEIALKRGAQISMPANLDGYRTLRAFSMFGLPVKKIKSTLNFTLGQTLTRTPAMINDQTNISLNSNTSLGLVLASNISENLDFTINYSSNYYWVDNSLQSNLNSKYVIQNFNARVNYLPTKHLVLSTDITNSSYNGLGAAFNQSIWLVNGGLGYKFLKDNKGELKLSVFDALKQNTSINRNVTETYIEDKNTQILTRFYLLTFTYSIRHFKIKGKK